MDNNTSEMRFDANPFIPDSSQTSEKLTKQILIMKA